MDKTNGKEMRVVKDSQFVLGIGDVALPFIVEGVRFEPGKIVMTPGAIDLLLKQALTRLEHADTHDPQEFSRKQKVQEALIANGLQDTMVQVLLVLEAGGYVSKHMSGQWGNLGHEDKQANEDALKHGLRILSAYMIEREKLWIITEADRSSTTLLLPSEY